MAYKRKSAPMQPTRTLGADGLFFFEHAGYSHGAEGPAEGRTRCAEQLALAEEWARRASYSFEWEIDPHIDSREFSDARPYWRLWSVVMRDENGVVCQSLGGVDFGRDREPWGDTYKRVCEAELALEQQCTLDDNVLRALNHPIGVGEQPR